MNNKNPKKDPDQGFSLALREERKNITIAETQKKLDLEGRVPLFDA